MLERITQKRKLIALILFVFTPWVQGSTAQTSIEDDAGYVAFGDLEYTFGVAPVIEANIYGAILDLVAEAAETEDPVLADLLRGVWGVYVRLQEEENAGMVVMSIDAFDDESAFLNIVGDIDPKQIGRIGRKFGVQGVSEI